MKKLEVEIGQQFGRWTVIKQLPPKNGKSVCICRCSCDKNVEREVSVYNLIHNYSKSCGCLISEETTKRNKLLARNNKFIKTDNHYVGILPNGLEFLFDIDDYDKVSQYCWTLSGVGYPVASLGNRSNHIYLHNLILGKVVNYDIDHINHNKLDNRKKNLRIVSHSENILNAKLNKNNKSGYKGVSWNKRYSKWEVFITINYKHIFLGRYDNLDDAIKARKIYENQHKIIS